MPSVSGKQHRLMEMVAHDPGAAKRTGIPKSVGEEFAKADEGRKFAVGGSLNPEKAIRAANMIARRVGRAPGGALSDAINSFSKEREDSLKRPASGSTGSDAALLAMLRPHPQLAIAEPEDSRRRMAPSGQVADLGAQIDEGAHWLAGQSGDESPVVSGVHQTAVKQSNAPALITTKSFSNTPNEIGGTPYTGSLTPAERDLMIRTVAGEAANQGPVGQAAVAHVILNRAMDQRWGGNGINGVILAPLQFSTWNKGDPAGAYARSLNPNGDVYKSIGNIVDGSVNGTIGDPTGGATHFYAPAGGYGMKAGTVPPWANGLAQQNDITIGGHRFLGRSNFDMPQSGNAVAQNSNGGVYRNIPDIDGNGQSGQLAKFQYWNPDPVGLDRQNLSEVHPDLQAVVNRARADNPGLNFVVGLGKSTPAMEANARKWGWSWTNDSQHLHGNSVDLWPLDNNGAVTFDPGQQRLIAGAMNKAASDLGVPMAWHGLQSEGGVNRTSRDAPNFGLINPRPLTPQEQATQQGAWQTGANLRSSYSQSPIKNTENNAPPAQRQVDAQGIAKVPNKDGSFTLTDQNGQTVGYDRGSAPLTSVPQSQPHMQPAQVPAQTAPPVPIPQPQQQPQQQPPSDQLGQADPMSNMFDRMAMMPEVASGYDSPQVLYQQPDQAKRGGYIRRAAGGPAYASMPTNELIARALEILRKHRDAGGSTNSPPKMTPNQVLQAAANQVGQQRGSPGTVSPAQIQQASAQEVGYEPVYGSIGRVSGQIIGDTPIQQPWNGPSAPAPAAPQAPVANNPAVAAGTVGNAAGATGSPIGTIPMAAPTQPPPPDWNNTLDQALQTNNPTMNQIFGFNYPQNLPSPKPQPQGPVSQDEINALYGFGGGSQMGTGTFQSGGAIIMDALNRARRAKGNKRNV